MASIVSQSSRPCCSRRARTAAEPGDYARPTAGRRFSSHGGFKEGKGAADLRLRRDGQGRVDSGARPYYVRAASGFEARSEPAFDTGS